ncbi:hypothetical protein MWU59_11495 [Flavobacteriaceae bacterium F08102]|nr:hypothetical protein [Flavobacteriaceae bacterium F08102]
MFNIHGSFPGSLVSLLYRNSLLDESNDASEAYFDGIESLFNNPLKPIFVEK